MKIIIVILLVLLVMLQYRVWLGEGGIPEVLTLDSEMSTVEQDVKRLQERNRTLDAEVLDLKTGLEAIEERARNELGMIHKDEVFYQVIENRTTEARDKSAAVNNAATNNVVSRDTAEESAAP